MPAKKKKKAKKRKAKKKSRKGVGGRPKIDLDVEQFEKLCVLNCNRREIAAWFKCSEDTVDRWCKRHYKETYGTVHGKLSPVGDIAIRRRIHQLAMEGHPTMLIWYSKNRLGWADKQEIKSDVKTEQRHVYYPSNGRGDE